jgi:hypothetical protein
MPTILLHELCSSSYTLSLLEMKASYGGREAQDIAVCLNGWQKVKKSRDRGKGIKNSIESHMLI